MSRTSVGSLRPFPFNETFDSLPAAGDAVPASDTVTLAAADLARIGAEMRMAGAAAAQHRLDVSAMERIESAGLRLERAAAQLAEVADAMDSLSRRGLLPADMARLTAAAARDIADGQGDLFAASQDLTANLPLRARDGTDRKPC